MAKSNTGLLILAGIAALALTGKGGKSPLSGLFAGLGGGGLFSDVGAFGEDQAIVGEKAVTGQESFLTSGLSTIDEDIGAPIPALQTAPGQPNVLGIATLAQTTQVAEMAVTPALVSGSGVSSRTIGITNQPVAQVSQGPSVSPANLGAITRAGFTVSGGAGTKPTVKATPDITPTQIGQLARLGAVVSGSNPSVSVDRRDNSIKPAAQLSNSLLGAVTRAGAVVSQSKDAPPKVTAPASIAPSLIGAIARAGGVVSVNNSRPGVVTTQNPGYAPYNRSGTTASTGGISPSAAASVDSRGVNTSIKTRDDDDNRVGNARQANSITRSTTSRPGIR